MFAIMNLKSRRLSLDGSVCLDLLIGGKRGSSKCSGKKCGQNPSVDEARLQTQDINHSLGSDVSLRKESVTKENPENSDGLIHINSFKKHNRTFHKLFQEIPEEEALTHTFICALQKELLYYGKLFVSEFHVCFHSSMLLKDTKVVIPVFQVRQVKKQTSALSMLSIQTADGEKYSFVSLRKRQMCYKLLQTICSHTQENSSPRLSSADNDADDVASSYSSLEECCGDQSQENSLHLQNNFPQMSCEGASTDHQGSNLADEDDKGSSWMGNIAARVTPFFVVRRMRNLSLLFYFYVMLMLLLLLLSGYIGLRISELEEQLKSLGGLTETSLPHEVCHKA
ncbi:GRAM domain-containing protein 2B-like isoform X2 [Antennarius striatus]|uniref:GRAM domain-containing protein 2B-like isoform X2 n=1 Tax=Antennarius striatus TaxID=241820 RepID=UPI0035AD991B